MIHNLLFAPGLLSGVPWPGMHLAQWFRALEPDGLNSSSGSGLGELRHSKREVEMMIA